MLFQLASGLVALVAGAVASVVGFGIGSLLTPLFAVRLGTRLAVSVVALPHVFGTTLRFWRLRSHVDRKVLLSFGITSALGGLAGALLHDWSSSHALRHVFGGLLLLAGTSELFGLSKRVRLGRVGGAIAGALSGGFGGLVGNQGGIRSAAMLSFRLDPQAFIATATATGLVVDAVRVPVYLAAQGGSVAREWHLVVIGIVGVVAGTLLGTRLLTKIPERWFRRFVAVVILGLGVYVVARW